MIDKLSKLGVDAVKFQMANPNLRMAMTLIKLTIKRIKTILEMSKKLQISKNNHLKLKKDVRAKI